jgi:NhaP-type Na+/H+ or K+/H+ antiporter
MWVFLGLGIALVVYIVLRFAWVWFICGGNSGSSNYYSDSEK